jgi:ATP-dependent Clp protease ATP-binding subunit ClpA
MRNHFSAALKEAISYSAEEAWRANSPSISAPHLFLGLLRVEDPAIQQWRKAARLPELTAALETMIYGAKETRPTTLTNSTPNHSRLPLDITAERIIRQTVSEAAGQKNIEPLHLLQSLIHNSKGSLAPLTAFYP